MNSKAPKVFYFNFFDLSRSASGHWAGRQTVEFVFVSNQG